MSKNKMEDMLTLNDFYKWAKEKITNDHRAKDYMICIPNNKGGMGGTSVTYIQSIHQGIDWDARKVFLYPDNKMVEADQEPIKDWKEIAEKWAEKQMPIGWDKSDINQLQIYYSYVFMCIRDAFSVYQKHI